MGPTCITTYTGGTFDYSKFGPDDIDIRDIAHALSHLCRFTGHTNIFYSVAQHCLLVSEKIPGGPEVKLAALLHDAAEAYVNDLSSPLKKWLVLNYIEDVMPGSDESGNVDPGDESYEWLHRKILNTVYKKYGFVTGTFSTTVKVYDKAACTFEQQAFMGTPVNSDGMLWDPWDPKGFAASITEGEFGQVAADFLLRFEELMDACGRSELV